MDNGEREAFLNSPHSWRVKHVETETRIRYHKRLLDVGKSRALPRISGRLCLIEVLCELFAVPLLGPRWLRDNRTSILLFPE